MFLWDSHTWWICKNHCSAYAIVERHAVGEQTLFRLLSLGKQAHTWWNYTNTHTLMYLVATAHTAWSLWPSMENAAPTPVLPAMAAVNCHLINTQC
jgi:hypothetical protein